MHVNITVSGRRRISNPDHVVRSLENAVISSPDGWHMTLCGLSDLAYVNCGTESMRAPVGSVRLAFGVHPGWLKNPHDPDDFPTFEEQTQQFETVVGEYTLQISIRPHENALT